MTTLTTLAAMLLLPQIYPAPASQTISKQLDSVTTVATIEAIDPTGRSVTLRNEKGEAQVYTVGPEIKRLNELKVGQKVKMRYYESVVVQVRKTGETSNESGRETAVTPTAGPLPGGTAAVQERRTVTIKSIDLEAPSLTVVGDDGQVTTRKIDNRKNLVGLRAGDRIDIVYTQAVLASVEPGN